MKALMILLALSTSALAQTVPPMGANGGTAIERSIAAGQEAQRSREADPEYLAKRIAREQWLAAQPKGATVPETFPRNWKSEIPPENRNP